MCGIITIFGHRISGRISYAHKFCSMKKLFCAFALMLFATSCKDEAHITVYEDMMYFLSAESDAGYVTPITNLTEEAPVRLNLYVFRSSFAANDHPKQTVRILVEEETTADPDTDFKLEGSELAFNKREEMRVPFQVVIRSSASGKKIVLRLDYGYTDVCKPEYRKADKLVIKIK